jgi:hypothetical protein
MMEKKVDVKKEETIEMAIRIAQVAAIIAGVILVAFFLLSGAYLPRRYLEPWGEGYPSNFADPRIKAASRGLLAGSMHNLQPWIVKLDPEKENTFVLYADVSRASPEVDPYMRQLFISQGTFLEMTRVAAASEGFRAEIELFPEGECGEDVAGESVASTPVARVELIPEDENGAVAFDVISSASVSRVAFKSGKLPVDQIQKLQALNGEEGLTLMVIREEEEVSALGELAVRAAEVEASVPEAARITRRVFRANEYEKNRHRDGFTLEGQGVGRFMVLLTQSIITGLPFLNSEKSATDAFLRQVRMATDTTPAYLAIISRGNSRREQVSSGMLYQRTQLLAAETGLSMQPLSQALEEYPEMLEIRSEVHSLLAPEGGTIQMLARIGVPTRGAQLTPRRDVMEFIVEGE